MTTQAPSKQHEPPVRTGIHEKIWRNPFLILSPSDGGQIPQFRTGGTP